MTTLLDSSVLIALLTSEHVHHEAAGRWLSRHDGQFATCPITQRAMIRLVLRRGDTVGSAALALASLTTRVGHVFWPDDLEYSEVRMSGVHGHRQVTDAYLAQLARRRDDRVATLDRGFAALHCDVADLVPIAAP